VPRAKLPAASEPALAALTEPLRMVLCCRMASTFDPESPLAKGGFLAAQLCQMAGGAGTLACAA